MGIRDGYKGWLRGMVTRDSYKGWLQGMVREEQSLISIPMINAILLLLFFIPSCFPGFQHQLTSGSTALAVFIKKSTLYIANLGDR